MAILFSQFKDSGKIVSDQSVVCEYSAPATSFVVNHYLENSPEYENAIVESMRGIFIAAKESRLDIAVDAFVDAVKALIRWFQRWFKKFLNFAKDSFKKIDLYFFKGKIVIDRFLATTPHFEPFVLKGYQYTIPTSTLNASLLSHYMSMVDEEIIQVLRADSATLNPRIAKAQHTLSSPELLDYFRGLLINRGPISSNVFKHHLKHFFRNNNLKADILCNLQTVTGFCEEYKLLSKQIESIKQNQMSIEININKILNFLEHEPEKYFDGYSTGSDLDRRKNLGIGAVYSSANAVIKQINFMYDFYFSAKIDAIYEAMQFYVRAASKALGSSALGTIKFATEDFIPDISISNEPIQESIFFFSGENYELNIDKWESGEIKLLFILGSSYVSSKSTAERLSKQYGCRKVELDFYSDLVKNERPEIKEWSDAKRNAYIVNHAIEQYKKERTIIEGTQTVFCDPGIISQYAVMIIGTSSLTFSAGEMEKNNPIILFKYALANSSPSVLKWNSKTYDLRSEFNNNAYTLGDYL